jgi:hypothetical protein
MLASYEASEKARAQAAQPVEVAKPETVATPENDSRQASLELQPSPPIKQAAAEDPRAPVHRRIAAALIKCGLTEEQSRMIVRATAKNMIPHMRIDYGPLSQQ